VKLVELTPAEAPKDAVPITPTSLYPNPVKFLYAIPDDET
jgi:hypothetical protein